MGKERTARLEKEAQRWQETDFAELADGSLEEIEVDRPRRPLSTTLAVRFDQRTTHTLRSIAEARGLGVTQLIRTWVLERLEAERRAAGLPGSDAATRALILQAVMEVLPEAVERAAAEKKGPE